MFQTIFVEEIKTHILCTITFFEIVPFMIQNIVQWGRTKMTIWRMHMACWVPKATNSHSEYDFFFTATMFARMRLNVTLHAHCLSCLEFLTLLDSIRKTAVTHDYVVIGRCDIEWYCNIVPVDRHLRQSKTDHS